MRWFVRAVCLILAGLLLGFVVPASQAASACDEIVIDATSESVLGNQSAIREEAQRLSTLGADVRVRAFDVTPGGNFDQYYRDQVRACASWAKADGQTPKGNLVVFLLGLDRQSAIYYGSNWHAALDAVVDHTRGSVMGDRFREGNFAQGIVDAERYVFAAMKAVQEEAAGGSSNNGAGVSQESPGAPSAPMDLSGFWRALLIVVGVLLLGTAIVVWFVYRKAHRAALRWARESHDRVLRDYAAMNGAMTNGEVQFSVEMLRGCVSANDQLELDAKAAAAKAATATADRAYQELRDHAVFSTITSGMSTADLEAAADAYDALGALIDTAVGVHSELMGFTDSLQKQIDALPGRLEAAERRYGGLVEDLAGLRQQGYLTDFVVITRMSEILERARPALQRGESAVVQKLLEEFEPLCRQAEELVRQLPQRHADLVGRHRQLLDRLRMVHPLVGRAEQQLAELESRYAKSCSSDIRDTPKRASVCYRDAATGLDVAGERLSMSRQEWEEAERSLADAETALLAIDDACRVVDDRRRELDELAARGSAPADDLIAAINQSIAAVNVLRGDQSKRIKQLRQLVGRAEALRGRLVAQKPDLLAVMRELETIQSSRRSLRDDAQAEHSRVVRAERRRRDEEQEEARRRASYGSSGGFGTGLATGYVAGSFGSSGWGGSSSSSSHDSGSFGGGGDSGGGSSGGW